MKSIIVVTLALIFILPPVRANARWERGPWEHAWSARSFAQASAKGLRWLRYRQTILRHSREF